MIARAADFYGPNAKTGIANVLVFEPMSKKQKANVHGERFRCLIPTPIRPSGRGSMKLAETNPHGTRPGMCRRRRTL